MTRAVLVPCSDAEPVEVTLSTPPTLEELQSAVRGPLPNPGYIELVRLRNGDHMYVNEEGKLYGLPYNETATRITRGILRDSDEVVGPAIILGPGDLEGYDTDATTTLDELRL